MPSSSLATTARPLVQRKATLGPADDAYEREADAVADRVTRMSDAGTLGAAPPAIRRACAEERTIRTKRASPNDATDAGIATAERTATSGGTPLAPALRAHYEPRFGRDFSNVRVHADGNAATAAHAVQARAYTFGEHIVFGAGQFAPGTPSGRHLIAHELAHVVQQGGGAPARVQRKIAPEYTVDEPFAGKQQDGVPVRINFVRNDAKIPASEQAKIDGFKSGADRPRPLELLGLATSDELATSPTLPKQRADAVNAELGVLQKGTPPFNMAHVGTRTVIAGTAANTKDSARLRFDRAVEILRPGEVSLNPSTATGPAGPCDKPLEKLFQDAKVMAFKWIDTTRPDLAKRPVPPGVAGSLDLYFGDHTDATVTRVDGNLGRIRDEIGSLAKAANHKCADPKDPGCVGAIANNDEGVMTICAGYGGMTEEDRARNLVHEAGHSTADLALRGKRKAPRTKDFSYRRERGVHHLGKINQDQALSNSDSYSMFLMAERASMAITDDMRPAGDPAPTGFAKAADTENAQHALALAERWVRLADQGIKDLHGRLRGLKGSKVPSDLGDPDRLDKILRQVKKRFPPILAGKDVTDDDLTMLAGVLDRYVELKRLFAQPVAIASGTTTAFAITTVATPTKPGALSLTVDAAFLKANELARARLLVDEAIELVSTSRIAVARRGDYGAFAQAVRELFQ